jgi:hypothetical protein
MERTFGLLWGYGKYSCLGKNIALMELNKVSFEVSSSLSLEYSVRGEKLLLTPFSKLLRNFEFTLMDPSHPWVSDNYGL